MNGERRIKRQAPAVIWGPFIAVGLLAACSAHQLDLVGLYRGAAERAARDHNPVVVIPGLLGSRLVTADGGRVIWGAYGGTWVSPGDEEGARMIALPLRATDPQLEVRADGILDRFQIRVGGLPFHYSAYAGMLDLLESVGYRVEPISASGDKTDELYNCFQFAYDWRRSNAANAGRLADFLRRKKAYLEGELRRRWGVDREVRFDLVAHSMGSLLARYYLRYGDQPLPTDGSLPRLTWEGAALVDRAFLLAPPNAGSHKAIIQLVAGVQFAKAGPRYDQVLLGTFPAAYELLPRGRHGAFVDAEDPTRVIEDVLDAEVWRRYGLGLAGREIDTILGHLLPDMATADERRQVADDRLAYLLGRARQFQEALDLPASPPAGTTLHLVASDSVGTGQVMALGRDGTATVLVEGPGDGSVLRSSALMDERLGREERGPYLETPIDWYEVLFLDSAHLDLTRDAEVADNLLFRLLEQPRPQRSAAR